MKKLLSMELKRAVFSPVLWIGCAAIILKNIYKILLSAYGFTIYTTFFIFKFRFYLYHYGNPSPPAYWSRL